MKTLFINTEALVLPAAVINYYGYGLLPNFGDLWNMGNLKNKEVIWAVDCSPNLTFNDAVYYSNAAGVPIRRISSGLSGMSMAAGLSTGLCQRWRI